MGDAFTPLSLACAAIAVAGMLANFILVAMRYPYLPDQVPRHYGITGKPSGWSSKRIIWAYPLILLVTLVAMAGVVLGVGGKPGPEELRTTLRQISLISAFVVVFSLALTLRTFAVAEKRAEGLGRLFLPAFVVVFVILGWLLRK